MYQASLTFHILHFIPSSWFTPSPRLTALQRILSQNQEPVGGKCRRANGNCVPICLPRLPFWGPNIHLLSTFHTWTPFKLFFGEKSRRLILLASSSKSLIFEGCLDICKSLSNVTPSVLQLLCAHDGDNQHLSPLGNRMVKVKQKALACNCLVICPGRHHVVFHQKLGDAS